MSPVRNVTYVSGRSRPAACGLFCVLIAWLYGLGTGVPAANTYDYANVFIYVAGLLNMLVVVDTFDIAMGRKQ